MPGPLPKPPIHTSDLERWAASLRTLADQLQASIDAAERTGNPGRAHILRGPLNSIRAALARQVGNHAEE